MENELKVEEVETGSLVHYKFNNKKHPQNQIDRLANAIREFGFIQPIVIEENNTIVAGHCRHLAAQKLELETVPCVRLKDLSEAQLRALRILDNKLAEDAEVDIDNLRVEMAFLNDTDIELEQFGLDELLSLIEQPGEAVPDDGFSERITIATEIQRGDIIRLNEHRLGCGDSTNQIDVALLLNDEQPVLCVTDPPYGVEYDPEWRDQVDLGVGERSRGEVLNDHRFDWKEAYEIYGAQVLYVWHAARLSAEFAISIERAGYEIVSQIIWAKQHFAISRGDYHWHHEPCWYAVKKGKTHNWQGSRKESTLWEIANNNSFGNREKEETWGHGTQKPLECMARPIRNNSKKGELICDPFLGSGTTLIAAQALGRRCYGMELSPEYCQVIVNRFRKYCSDNETECQLTLNGEEWNGETR
jgi:DNA modification methylase